VFVMRSDAVERCTKGGDARAAIGPVMALTEPLVAPPDRPFFRSAFGIAATLQSSFRTYSFSHPVC